MTSLQFLLFFVLGQFFASLFVHTFFLHRYVTHQQFSMTRFWQKFFYILTWLFQGPAFLDPVSYAMLHLEHHEHADSELDPHAPGNSHDVLQMMWKTKLIFVEVRQGKHRIFELYKQKKFPRWPEFTGFANSGTSMILMVMFFIGLYFVFAPVWWCWLFLPITLLNGPIQGAIVNWCGHKYGSRNFDTPDRSKNTPLAGLMFGELYQNNHHKAPQDPNFAKKWYEFDPVYPVILLFDLVGVICLPKK